RSRQRRQEKAGSSSRLASKGLSGFGRFFLCSVWMTCYNELTISFYKVPIGHRRTITLFQIE
ncbi:MAG: hypothetical protein LUC91_00160, partial [Prevotella sp.]|nr:hypothetical protein [Prevotella sp.]